MAVEYLLFDQDRFKGGHTGGGFSLPSVNGSYSGTITINIPPGSTIRKAYLIAGRHGNAGGCNVIFNGTPNPFTPANAAIVPNFNSIYGGNSSVHIRDVTAQVNAAQNVYAISVPNQPGPSNRFEDFYLYVKFNNAAFPFLNTFLFLNKLSFTPTGILSYPLAFPIPISAASPVMLALMCGYACNANNNGDGYRVRVNGNLLGLIGGNNPNSPIGPCAGPHGDFSHYNGTITGLNGSNPNQAMSGVDCVSNISSIPGINGATSFTVELRPDLTGNNSNACWALMVSYEDSSVIYECGGCADLTVTNLLPTSARLNWGNCSGINVVSFVNQIQYRPIGSPVWTSITVGTPYIRIPDVINLQNSPPITPSFNDRYIVAPGATGAWFGYDNNIATWNGIAWFFTMPLVNQAVFSITTSTRYFFDGSMWNAFTLVNFVDIFGLTPGTTYEWQVINLDTDGSQCAPSSIHFFTTP